MKLFDADQNMTATTKDAAGSSADRETAPARGNAAGGTADPKMASAQGKAAGGSADRETAPAGRDAAGGTTTASPGGAVLLGGPLTLEDFVRVVRGRVQVLFSDAYVSRVERSRAAAERWIGEGLPIYGVNTGFGALSEQAVSREESALLQKNILLSHAVSVGAPLPEEVVRGTMLMVLQNLGQGYSGVRMVIPEAYRQFLNRGITPWAPGEGSVGYLSPEAHMALVLTGEGRAYYKGALVSGSEALARAGLEPVTLAEKEGLALVSGTTSVTAMGALALYDMIGAAKAADLIGALSLENSGGLAVAFDERVMKIRPHEEQASSADNVRRILADSQVLKAAEGTHLQDPLSLRCIPQLHGAAKKTLYDAGRTIETEMNACCDNPIIWPEAGAEDVISACNADSAYVGIEMDSAAIAATALAKMSERRTAGLLGGAAGLPPFLTGDPGLNSGLMVTQYTQAGLLGSMRVLSHPATVDNTPTCGGQEDYVAMGYNAAKKALQISEDLEYVLAIELLADYRARKFAAGAPAVSSVSARIYAHIAEEVPLTDRDEYFYPYIECLRALIHSGELVKLAEDMVGPLV